MTLTVIIYNCSTIVKGFIGAYLKRIHKNIYSNYFTVGFVERFITKLNTLTESNDKLIVLQSNKHKSNTIYFNIKNKQNNFNGIILTGIVK